MLKQGYTDFLIQNIILTEQFANDAKPTYELSLFGVMLCLVVISYNDMDRLKGGLYFKESSFEEYYDLVALNYREKLPLIFGKWNQLKGILKVSAYYNFDIILDREIRSNNKYSSSVRKGGNKELIEGIREIILDNSESMSKFVSAGWDVLENDLMQRPEGVDRPSLRGMLHELKTLLDPYLIKCPVVSNNMMGFITRDTRSVLNDMEESFEDEITAFYYMNLHNDSNIAVSEPRKYYLSFRGDSSKPSGTPKQCLSLLLEQDKEKPLIKEWLTKWMDYLRSIQKEVLKKMEATH